MIRSIPAGRMDCFYIFLCLYVAKNRAQDKHEEI